MIKALLTSKNELLMKIKYNEIEKIFFGIKIDDDNEINELAICLGHFLLVYDYNISILKHFV